MLKTISFYATLSFFGRLPMPGTLASLALCPIFILFSPFLLLQWQIVIGCCLFASGWLFTFISIKNQDDKDPREITIDEVAGMWIALCFVPLDIVSIVFCFLIFRILDIFKPPPINKLETLPYAHPSLRVMLDDLASGLLAGAITFVLSILGVLGMMTRGIGFLITSLTG